MRRFTPNSSGMAAAPVLLLLVPLGFLGLFLAMPLLSLMKRSVFENNAFTGLDSLRRFFATPGLSAAFSHTLIIGAAVTAITLVLAFVLAYAVTHTRFKGRNLCRAAAFLPLFVPSLFPALGLIYLFGAQGLVTMLVGDIPLYGPLGIVLGSVMYTLPHALLPLLSALSEIDADLHLAARTLGAGPWRRFVTVTVPGARYGLVSAAIVIFVLTITDFGVPKVLGGEYSMLATEIFKQVVGLQDFTMGATVSLALLLPCVPAFLIDGWARKKQRFQRRGRPYIPEPSPKRDAAFTALGWAVPALPLVVITMVVWGSFIAFWPYELTPTLANYGFERSVYGAAPFAASLYLGAVTAVLGAVLIFSGAYLVERTRQMPFMADIYRMLAILPLAVPGTVLGLAYILAFNTPDSPLRAVYGTIPFLACNCVVHFYTVCHFTASGSLARLDPNYETVGATLGAPRFRTVLRVVIPMQKESIADVAFYLFVNALTTISAVVFLYSPGSLPASVAILQMMDSGAIAEASAMGTLILAAALTARLLRKLV